MLRIVFIVFLATGCATLFNKSSNDSSADNTEDSNDIDYDEDGFGGSSGSRRSGKTQVVSLGKNNYYSPKIPLSAINNEIDELSNKSSKTRNDYIKLISLQGLVRKSFSSMWVNAQKLASITKAKKVLPDETKLDLGVAALRAGKYSVASYFLLSLTTEARSVKVKASAYNAIGSMRLLEKNYQGASLSFKKALSLYPNYQPSILNLGLLQVKFGDFVKARRTLSASTPSWFVNSVMIVIERHLGNVSRAVSLCNNILSSKPNHKISKVNCAILQFEENKNFQKARKLLQDAVKIHGGGDYWEDIIYKLLEDIDNREFNKQLQANN